MGGKGSGRPVTAQCGTTAGYRKHIRTDKQPCAACKQAWADYYRNRPKKSSYKPKGPRIRKRLGMQVAHAYVNKQKREVGACVSNTLDGSICPHKCIAGNEHHFDWDHIVPKAITKSKGITEWIKIATTFADLDREIAKCQLLCKFCHANKSIGNNGRQMHKLALAVMTDDNTERTLFDGW